MYINTYIYSYIHIHIYLHTYIYLCREDSAAVQRCVEVECRTRQVTQEDTACMYHHVCTYIHALTLCTSAASAPSSRSSATVLARQAVALATCNADPY